MRSKIFLLLLVVILLALLISPVAGEMSDNPPEVGETIRGMGNALDMDVVIATDKLYGPLQAKSPKEGVNISQDLEYGAHKLHTLDVYEPIDKPDDHLPIILYLHGGSFVEGDKNEGRNAGLYFARHNVVFISMNYRLAPEIKWPEGTKDIGEALKWIHKNGTKYGGDPNRIFLFGSSAGAAHASHYIFFEENQIPDDKVVGAILFSVSNADMSQVDERSMAYFGKDKSKHENMSFINNVDGRIIPIFMLMAELDPLDIQLSCSRLINALYERDSKLPLMKVAIGHNHVSTIFSFNTKDDVAGPEILEFIQIN